MKVFATRFLEPMKGEDNIPPVDSWSWQPANPDIKYIYASGGPTKSQESTYASERDNRSDTDRPNEGYLVV
ncbi:MAG: hypothetical protein V7L21_26485 [Nostoc sp.]|uniref:hypothetical protein n=1 Tax=Nostoc sp. TaxID=1180 RepID=UPI002FF938D8